ncbi:Nucleolar protein 9 [Thelohanellus kitauei]|uniref:Nucleolar protein 9 n=1 Tax=Thelohanellus kitauei TaxID=669202 RepID=A0A0C2M9C8_THEKT|nr:Nucleolar protein 9 [Thelohanellus kitauei]
MEDTLRLPSETMNYFIRTKNMLDKYKKGPEKNEEMEIIKCQVLEVVSGIEFKCVRNAVASHVVERILPYMKEGELSSLLLSLSDHIVALSEDRYASHVIQRLIEFVSLTLYTPDNSEKFSDVISTMKTLIKKSDDLFCHIYAKHVMRALIELIGHIQVTQRINSQCHQRKSEELLDRPSFYTTVTCQSVDTKIFVKLLKRLFKKLKKHLDFSDDMVINYSYSILAAYNLNQEQFDLIFNHVYEWFLSKKIYSVVSNPTTTFLVQLLFIFSEDSEVHKRLFFELQPSLSNALTDKVANNVILSALASVKSCEVLENWISLILDAIIQSGFPTLLNLRLMSSILEKSKTLKSFENHKSKKVLSCFGECSFRQIITLNPQIDNVLDADIVPAACHFLACYFDAGYCNSLVLSFLELTLKELTKIMTDPSGSRVVDAFFRSGSVSYKLKVKLLKKIDNREIAKYSRNKYSVYCIENFWLYLSDDRKAEIASLISDSVHFKTNNLVKHLARKLKFDQIKTQRHRKSQYA